MTKQYQIVHLNGFMYTVDKEAKIGSKDWFYSPKAGSDNITHIFQEYYGDESEEYRKEYDYRKIIATNDPVLNLPLLPAIDETVCPKCYNNENFHFNYDYTKKEMPIEEILCNECGEFFKDSPKPIAVEIEMEEHRYLGAVDCGDPDLWEPDPTYTPKVKNNIVQVKGWIYE